MEALLPGFGLIVGLFSLVAAVRMADEQARSPRMAVVQLRDERRRPHEG